MKRHTLAALAFSAPILAACSTTAPVNLQSVANDIALIATSFNTGLNNPAVVKAIPGGLPASVTAALTDLQLVATAAANAPDATAMKGSVVIVERDVQTIVGALAGLPNLPANVSTILTAATVLLPVLEAAVGIVAPAPAGTSAAVGGMSPGAARVHLMTGK
jgi:hypothetical protein